MSAMAVEDVCDYSDLPLWLCPHCPEFARPVPPAPVPEPAPVVELWQYRGDGRGTHKREWTGLDEALKPVVVICDHEGDQPVCPDCIAKVGSVLDDIPALLFDLDISISRATRFVEHGQFTHDQGDPEEAAVLATSLPWNDKAAKARARLIYNLKAIGYLVRVGPMPPALMAERIRKHLPKLARREEGPELLGRLTSAVAAAHRAIDQPPSPWYYGPCPQCGKDIYAERIGEDDDAKVVCGTPECGYSATLHEHRLTQLDLGEDRMLTVSELVGAITSAGEQVSRAQINNWIRREGLMREKRSRPRLVSGGKLETVEVYVYRLGDVRKLAAASDKRRAG